MSSEPKSDKALLQELAALRQQVADLEAQLTACRNARESERTKRQELDADIEFIGDFDVVNAKGINISAEGICLKLSDDLPFEMQFEQEGQPVRRRAHLIWLKRLETGGYHFGFKFVNEEPYPEF